MLGTSSREETGKITSFFLGRWYPCFCVRGNPAWPTGLRLQRDYGGNRERGCWTTDLESPSDMCRDRSKHFRCTLANIYRRRRFARPSEKSPRYSKTPIHFTIGGKNRHLEVPDNENPMAYRRRRSRVCRSRCRPWRSSAVDIARAPPCRPEFHWWEKFLIQLNHGITIKRCPCWCTRPNYSDR